MATSIRETPAILRGDAGLIFVGAVFVVGRILGTYHAIAYVAGVLTPERSMAGTVRTFLIVFRP